jgi:hypothetical protein
MSEVLHMPFNDSLKIQEGKHNFPPRGQCYKENLVKIYYFH